MWGYFDMRNLYFKTIRQISKLDKKIQVMFASVSVPRITRLDGMPRSNSDVSPLEFYLIRKEKIEEEKKLLELRKFSLENDLNNYIDQMKFDFRTKKIVEIKTFDIEKPWQEIEKEFKLCKRQLIRIYTSALNEIKTREQGNEQIHNKSN